ncbi:IS607 family element RNA-guided endonuclease TnpB [Nonomuraea sp. 3-1Str]|uniref:IS607 family element RNA-guided endonuclease TnpB n=1 Tax=Nonomuraea sp. 3-1Str TaxID=2929801 RepID=UPI00285E7D59|nr:IS607 family element RNA-guided endonuclease TnpB [Nonomuraea sp. 3-1Str]MDR8410264.1 IS607 family element RNA-guided endonuclease TnpB [Nonomuraea sp. 3-1Str]
MAAKFQAQTGFVVQAYRFALDPNAGQTRALASHCGAARVAFNWGLALVKANLDQRDAERSYGIPEGQLTPSLSWSMYSLRKVWNTAKGQVAPWWEDNSKEAYSSGLERLAVALKNWSDSKKGKRKGPRMGFPAFRSKRKAVPSIKFTTGAIRVEDDRRHVTLPRLGTIRTHESTRKLQRRLTAGTGRIMSATVRHERGRWFVSFQVEVQRAASVPARPDTVVGVDLGVKCLAVLADSAGEVRYEPNPAHLDGALKHLRRLSRLVSRRQGPDRRTGQQPSKRWLSANTERNKVHHQVANLRADGLHKLTTRLAAEYGTVVVEDLNVAGMLRNRRLARNIADAGFGEIRRQITYKTGWNGGAVHVADRWYPSSKTCSKCGAVKAKLPLRVRVFDCDNCPLVMDRDENAARNLAALAAACTTGTGVAGDQDAQASKPRGADQKTRATRLGRKAESGRAGGATPHQREEARDRTQDTEAQPALW